MRKQLTMKVNGVDDGIPIESDNEQEQENNEAEIE